MREVPLAQTLYSTGDIAVNLQSFVRHLRAANRSDRTIDSYIEGIEQLAAFLHERAMPECVADITREHLQEYISHLLETRAPATAANRYRSLRRFFRWLREEGEVTSDPTARMPAPFVPEGQPRVLTEEELHRLVAVCEKDTTFEGRRDTALVRCYIDTGCRLSEIAGLKYNPHDADASDIDLEGGHLYVMGKGRRERPVPIGTKTIKALDRYLRKRDARHNANLPALWIGPKGGMTDSGISQALRRRAEQAGIEGFHPHCLRHSFAHHWLTSGGTEGDAMAIAGWRSRSMLQRYASTTRADRAKEAHKRLGLGDRL